MVGGGAYGKGGGIAHRIMTGIGRIMTVFQDFILMSTQVGEDTTESMRGTGTGGTINGFLPNNFNGTGRAGRMIGIGNGKALGASRTINRAHKPSDRH